MVDLKLAQLRNLFTDMGQALIAYSGGIDSTLEPKSPMMFWAIEH